jgi:hypothetical protein
MNAESSKLKPGNENTNFEFLLRKMNRDIIEKKFKNYGLERELEDNVETSEISLKIVNSDESDKIGEIQNENQLREKFCSSTTKNIFREKLKQRLKNVKC